MGGRFDKEIDLGYGTEWCLFDGYSVVQVCFCLTVECQYVFRRDVLSACDGPIELVMDVQCAFGFLYCGYEHL